MKTRILQTILLTAAFAFMSGLAHASFHGGPVRLDVRVNGGDCHARNQGSSAVKHDQKEELEITVSSVSKNLLSGMQLKRFIFGRDGKSNRVSVLRAGEAKVELGQRGSQVIQSAKIEAKSKPEHSVVSRGRGGRYGGSCGSVKKVEATGDKYIGYGVQVFNGGKVVSENFYPPSLNRVSVPASVPYPSNRTSS